MTDKEKWILGVAGSLATIAVGYLVWRHESAINQAQAQQNLAAQQQASDDLVSELSNYAVPTLSGGYGNGSSDSYFANGSLTDPTSSNNSDLEAILQAFFGTGSTSSTSQNGGSTTPATDQTQQPTAPTSSADTGFGVARANPVQHVTSIFSQAVNLDPTTGSTSLTPVPRATPILSSGDGTINENLISKPVTTLVQ